MVISKRERYIIAGSALVLGVLGLDQFVLNPLLNGWSQAQRQKETLHREMTRSLAARTIAREQSPRWKQMVAAGIKPDPAEAESQALHAIRDWAVESGVTLAMVKPDRLTEKTHLPAISFQAGGAGSMEAIAKWLWRMQYAKIPIRITELQLASRKEGTDDLTVQLRLSTLYMPAQAPAPAKAATGARSAESER